MLLGSSADRRYDNSSSLSPFSSNFKTLPALRLPLQLITWCLHLLLMLVSRSRRKFGSLWMLFGEPHVARYLKFVQSSLSGIMTMTFVQHDDVIKWKYFPRYWPFVRGIHRSPVTSPHKGQWRGALMFSLICDWINSWVTIVRLVIWDAITLIMTSRCLLIVAYPVSCILVNTGSGYGVVHQHRSAPNIHVLPARATKWKVSAKLNDCKIVVRGLPDYPYGPVVRPDDGPNSLHWKKRFTLLHEITWSTFCFVIRACYNCYQINTIRYGDLHYFGTCRKRS